jgi:hypothetical protein
LTLSQLKETHYGRRLLKMQRTRMEAARPVLAASACWAIQQILHIGVVQAVLSKFTPLLTHPVVLLIIAVYLLAAKFHQLMVSKVLLRSTLQAVSFSIIAFMHFTSVLAEACRSYPRISREHYTRTKVQQRRLFGIAKPAAPVKIKRRKRLSRRNAKRIQKSASARISNILKRLHEDSLRSKARHPGLVQADPELEMGPEPVANERSWRNPVRDRYRITAFTRFAHKILQILAMALVVTAVASMLAIPVALGTGATGSAVEVTAGVGFINYQAAEVQAQQRAELARIKMQPFDGEALTDKFSHSINSHLPDGIKSKPDPTEYWKDPETKLTLHRLPHLTQEQFDQMVNVTRKHADGVVAYTLLQITGYNGNEPPLSN